MFDITSWVRETVFRRPKLIQSIAGEELSEKQTTKMGYFLLICMFFAIISTAQWTLSIIKDIPDRPTRVPLCASSLLAAFDLNNTAYSSNNYNSYMYEYSYGGYNNCALTSTTNPEFDLTDEYNILQPQYEILQSNYQELSRLESERNKLQYQQGSNREDYNTSIYEGTAGEGDPIYDGNQIRSDIMSNRELLSRIESQIQDLERDISNIKTQNSSKVSLLQSKYDKAESVYYRANLFYRMKIALLSLFFAGSVFMVLYRLYVRRKIENSPHTIIFSVATFAYWLVFLQILLMFLWDIIPHKFLEWLLGIISLFTPLLYLVQFLWPIIIVAIFGFLVYRIQKRLYSPSNVLKRFVMDKKCPNCGNAVDMTRPFCPLCSHEIHIHCPHCHELTMKGMPYCSSCGTDMPDENEVIKTKNILHISSEAIQSQEYSGVVFYLDDSTTFVSRRETIIQLALYIQNKLQKNIFAAWEFLPLMENILNQVDKKSISQIELDRITGKIEAWAKVGWRFELQKR